MAHRTPVSIAVDAGTTGVRTLAIDEAGDSYSLFFSGEGAACGQAATGGLCAAVAGGAVAVLPGPAVAMAATAPVTVQAGEAFSVAATLRDAGGNVAVNATARNATATLYSVAAEVRQFSCRGLQACAAAVNSSLPGRDTDVLSARLRLRLACTDYSYVRDYVAALLVGDVPLESGVDFDPGPWDGCYGSCAETRNVVSDYGLVQAACWDGEYGEACLPLAVQSAFLERWQAAQTLWTYLQTAPSFDLSAVAVELTVTPTVNYYPCDGDFVFATLELELLYVERESARDLGTAWLSGGAG